MMRTSIVVFASLFLVLSFLHDVTCVQPHIDNSLVEGGSSYSVFECQSGSLVDQLKESLLTPKWIELGDKLVAPIFHEVADISYAKGCKCVTSYSSKYYMSILQRDHRHQTKSISELSEINNNKFNENIEVAVRGWGFYVVLSPSPLIAFESLITEEEGWRVIPSSTHENITLVGSYASSDMKVATKNEVIDKLVAHVDSARWFGDLTHLATFNRYTRGTGIAAAQSWIVTQLNGIAKTNPNITVATQAFPVGATTAYNIIATINGYITPDEWVIVGGHYDSTSQSPTSSAPGAEDNASGAAAVLEMVRAFATQPPPSSVIFVFFSGEEQGLYGSTYHATQVVRDGNAAKVRLMHNMDMIAYKAASNPAYTVLIETNKPFDSFFPSYTESATTYTKLTLSYSTYAFGSDHEPYLNRGMPGVLTIDGDWDSYPDYHRTTDTPAKCNQELGFQIVQMGVATIAKSLGY